MSKDHMEFLEEQRFTQAIDCDIKLRVKNASYKKSSDVWDDIRISVNIEYI